jgi:hypothetical protein
MVYLVTLTLRVGPLNVRAITNSLLVWFQESKVRRKKNGYKFRI